MLQTFNVPAGGRQINAKGNFFRYESAGASGADEPVRVRADGQDLGSYLPGDSIELPSPASTWEVTPASGAQTCIVRVGLGRIETARLAGVVAITNKVASSQIIGGGGFLAVGFNATQFVAPGSNVRGLIVRGANCGGATSAAGGGNAAQLQMVAAPSAPAALSPTNGFLLQAIYNPTTAYAESAFYDKNISFPPGWGVWLLANNLGVVASSSGGTLCCELL